MAVRSTREQASPIAERGSCGTNGISSCFGMPNISYDGVYKQELIMLDVFKKEPSQNMKTIKINMNQAMQHSKLGTGH